MGRLAASANPSSVPPLSPAPLCAVWDSLVFRVGPQACPGRDGREREHEGGHTLGPGALRRPGAVQVAIRRVVQRRDARQPDGERRHTRVRRRARVLRAGPYS